MAKNLKFIFSGIAGIVAPIVALVCIFTAVGTYSAFSWQNNALSDLGSMNQEPTRSLFNYGLIAGGIMALGFAYGLKNYLRGWEGGTWAAIAFALEMLTLVGIGVFPGDFMPSAHVHYYVSVAFFVLFPVVGFMITYGLLKTGQKKLAGLTLLLAILAALVWIAHWTAHPFGPGVAIPEIVAAMCAGAWVAIVGALMVKKGFGEGSPSIENNGAQGREGSTGNKFFNSVIEE